MKYFMLALENLAAEKTLHEKRTGEIEQKMIEIENFLDLIAEAETIQTTLKTSKQNDTSESLSAADLYH